MMAKLIPVLKWGDDEEENLARGELEKFNFVESQRNTHKFNDQVVGCKGGFDYIWRHVADDWFKVIAKTPERSC